MHNCGKVASTCTRLELESVCVGCMTDIEYQYVWSVDADLSLDDTTTYSGATDKLMALRMHAMSSATKYTFTLTGLFE